MPMPDRLTNLFCKASTRLRSVLCSMKSRCAFHAPKIAPEHLLRRTKGQTIVSTVMSLSLVFLSTSTLTTEQLNTHWQLYATIGFIVGLVSVFRNPICDWVYTRVSFALYYEIRSYLQTLLSITLGLTMGIIWSRINTIPRSVFGPIFSIALTVSAIICAIGIVVSTRNEASLKLAQSLYEANRGNMKEAFKWFDRGMYMIIRMLRELGRKLDAPQLRLGGRAYYGKCGKNAKIIRDLSQAVLNIDDREQLQRVEDLTIQLNEHGKDAISRGIKPQPLFVDYLDRRHLTLDNIYKIVLILAALFGIVWTIRTGITQR